MSYFISSCALGSPDLLLSRSVITPDHHTNNNTSFWSTPKSTINTGTLSRQRTSASRAVAKQDHQEQEVRFQVGRVLQARDWHLYPLPLRGGYRVLIKSWSHCVLLSALTYTLSLTPFITYHILYITHHACITGAGDNNNNSQESTWSLDSNEQRRSKQKEQHLASLFAPPHALMETAPFEDVRKRCQEVGDVSSGDDPCKWLMVNIQLNEEFACQELNRDVWSNDMVQVSLIFRLGFRGILLYTGDVLCSVECCITQLWCPSIIFYNQYTDIYPLLNTHFYLWFMMVQDVVRSGFLFWQQLYVKGQSAMSNSGVYLTMCIRVYVCVFGYLCVCVCVDFSISMSK